MAELRVLVPVLYELLESHFGSVIVANQGQEMLAGAGSSPLTRRRVSGGYERTGTRRPQVISSGEYYRVNCPKCGDTRHRLWVNHRIVEYPMLMVCYNENCFSTQTARDQLLFQLFRTRKPNTPKVLKGRRDGARLGPVELPGEITLLHELPASHPANTFLADERGFDPFRLSRDYGLAYCHRSDRYAQCVGRIVIPVVMRGQLVGWQARFVGERNWKTSSVPKYWDRPGMAKRLMLYNFDRAKGFPWVGIQEGVTDVWATGPMMMALLGKTLSYAQNQILAFDLREKPIVVMLDGDAAIANEGITDDLRREHPGGVVMVTLPDGTDPGQFRPEVNLDLIYRSAADQGVRLDPF